MTRMYTIMTALLVLGFGCVPSIVAADTFSVTDLRCEDLVDPIGIDSARPRLSWRMQADTNGAAQTAYRVLCATSPKLLREGAADLWDSGRIETDQSQHVTYAGRTLDRGVPCYWAVRIWNEKGDASDWSDPSVWTVFDMTSGNDWKAQWITQNHKGSAVPWLRRSFQLDAAPARAYIYVNALGYFQLFINGKRVGNDEFAPHVGQYDKRTFCLTYDVAQDLDKGKNVIGFWLGSGWNRNGAGVETTPAVRAQLEIVDAGGKSTTVITDENWRAKPSSMSCTGAWKWGNFGGEVHDARLDEPDWADPDYDDSAWSPAKSAETDTPTVSAEMLQPSRVIETITPATITKLGPATVSSEYRVANGEKVEIEIRTALYGDPDDRQRQADVREKLQKMADAGQYSFSVSNDLSGRDPAYRTRKVLLLEYVLNGESISKRVDENTEYALVTTEDANEPPTSWLVDMGKTMTGTFEITFPGAPAGHKVSMEFGDSIGKERRLNSFKQVSTYICRGSGTERFKNRFNYASCRYIHITNAPGGEMTPADVKGFLITTDLPKASTFSCSDETLNKIYGMMEHTLRCLMLGGYQVDCHSRERQGYGGDGHSSLDTTLCLLRSDAFYRKWTRDWVDQQKPDGGLTYTSPASGHGGGPFWCGFLTAATLKHYQHYGDLAMVQRNYPAIRKWFELAQSKTVDDLQQKFCGGWYLGDWASPKGVDDRGSKGNAEAFIQPYMCYALKQAADLADILGKADDAGTFRTWAEARGHATHREFYDPQGTKYGSGDQVTYILPLAAGIVPDELRDDVFAGFERTLREKNNGHLSTGLSGTYMMVQYLQSIGRDDLIYLFASKKTYPSWGYMIENGATATWEHWNGRASRIHNCYNNIASWFIQGLAGIRPDTARPGFKNAVIRPAVLRELNHVTGSHNTVYGTVRSNWKRNGDTVTLSVGIPANSTATVHVPVGDVKDVTVNGKAAVAAPHVDYLRSEGGRVLLQVESGSYEIVIRSKTPLLNVGPRED